MSKRPVWNDRFEFDFFLSRRGSVAALAQEVCDVLAEQGYKVFVQDYDIPLAASFIERMHEGIKCSRDLIILYTPEYEESPYTRKEFTSFEAEKAQSLEDRRVVILRCEDAPLRGLMADYVYQDIVGINDPQERKRRIVAAAEGHSQAAPPPPRPFVGAPARIAGFTGRVDELDRLDAVLVQKRPAAVIQSLPAGVGRAAVQGLGGVGKTSLAVEYAHRFRDLYAGVWWCPAETRAGLLTSLATLAIELGAATTEEADVEKAAKAALLELAARRATWLLVYENVTAPEEVAQLLPSAGASVLITSRFSDWREWADEIPLDVLPIDEAVGFLQRRADRDDETGAQTLALTLGQLPLALDHAAATCRRTQMAFAEYAARASSLMAKAPIGTAYPRSVAATFGLAIETAATKCSAVEELIAFLAQCAPERIPVTLVEGAIEDETLRLEALGALAEVSLVKHDPFEDGTPAVTVHRLVQVVARARSSTKGKTRNTIQHFDTRLVAIHPDDAYSNPTSWPPCAQFMPHVLARRSFGSDITSHWPEILSRTGSYLHGRAAFSQADPLLRDALAIRERTLGPDHIDTALSLNNLALLIRDQGDYAEARTLLERALAINERVLGSDHPRVGESLIGLASVLWDQGSLAGARSLLERALAINERVFGSKHLNTAISLNNLGVLLNDQGEFVNASSLLRRALAIREELLGPAHPYTASTIGNLALSLQAQGDFWEARSFLERALAIDEKTKNARC